MHYVLDFDSGASTDSTERNGLKVFPIGSVLTWPRTMYSPTNAPFSAVNVLSCTPNAIRY